MNEKKESRSLGSFGKVAAAVAVAWSMWPSAAVAADTYAGTLYIAGMGGHVATVEVKIDPSRPDPISVVNLGRMTLNDDPALAKKAYPIHDVRIDQATKTLFWSAYVPDGDGVRAGKLSLASGKMLSDVKLPKDPKLTLAPMYCGSGQTKDKFLPVIMGYQGSIDVVDKASMKLEHRVSLDHPKIPKNYVFTHGVNSPDGKEFALWLSLSDKPGTFPRGNEKRQMVFILDMPALVAGSIKILRETTLESNPMSVFFRGYYTSDGKQLLISGRDRNWVLDAKTLKVLAETENLPGVETHDFQPLPGNRYAVLTQRTPMDIAPGKKGVDGQIELYDLVKKQRVGKTVSVCDSCHKPANIQTTAVLCGIDSVWKL